MSAEVISYRKFQHYRAAKLSERAAELEASPKYRNILRSYAKEMAMRARANGLDRE